MKRITQLPFFLFLLFTIGLVSCSDYGKKIKIEGTQGEIFYKDGVSEDEAKQVGNILKDDFLGNEKRTSIQVVKEKEEYTVRFVYDKAYYEKNPGFDKDFQEYAVKISKEVFDGKKVNVALSNDHFKDYKKIPFEQPKADSIE